ncbi:MAG: NAD(P)-binding protein, partial [Candidatus Omnitrophota bacterium]
MEYDAIIIGAGAGGLSAGVSLSAAGKKVLVLEKLPVPGGFATTFSRKGFVFESALHCIDSLQEGGEIRNFLAEHGIVEKIGFIPLKDFSRVIYPGHDFILTFSRDDFIAYLKQEFPGESRGIDRIFGAFDKFYRQFDAFQDSRMPLALRLFLSPFIYPEIIRASMATAEGFIARHVKEIKLKGILTSIWSFMGLAPARLSAFYFLLVFRFYYY